MNQVISLPKNWLLAQVFVTILSISVNDGIAQESKGELVYECSFGAESDLKEWTMEGPGETEFGDGWMRMYSPNEEGHHVYWCPIEVPESFVAQWEVRNLNPEAGLCIVFFAANGLNEEDLLDAKLKSRDGVFKQYTKGDINNYHISYYANTPTQKDRPHAHLRKNKGFHKVHVGEEGIPADSNEIHKVKLVKTYGHIQMYIDGSPIIDWQDDGQKYGPVLGAGKIGFRQMKWTRFQYRNLIINKL